MKPYKKGVTSQEHQQPDTRGTKSGDEMLLLQTQEDILNAIGAQVLAEVEAEQAKQNAKGLKRFFRRRRKD